ncbi:ROK family protein (plasmid) [Brevundimonas staleyi]|uniref:ROK family protein n=1 Tax=Brevundimonas staleyi TaxID=74326 RepID=A0ABW0FQ82_9CAUL
MAIDAGLTPPAITQICKVLLHHGLVHELPARKGQRGQPSRPLAVDPAGGFAGGVNFSHSYMEVGVMDLSGRLLGVRKTALGEPRPQTIADTAVAGVRDLVRRHRVPADRMLGLGFAVPGDFREGGRRLLAHPAFPHLNDQDLGEIFQSASPWPVFVENDGRTSAIGERIIGIGRGLSAFMLIHIGHGVGGGLIIDGRPFRGARGNAGPIGLFFPYGLPRPSGEDLLAHLRAAGLAADDFDALDALDLESSGALDVWLGRAGEQLGRVLPLLGRFIDPEAIVIAGRLPPVLLDRLAEVISQVDVIPPGDPLPGPAVVASRLGSLAGVVGAASLPIYERLIRGASGEPKSRIPAETRGSAVDVVDVAR